MPLPPNGKLFGNRAAWKEKDGSWRLLQELMAGGIWEIYLYYGTDPFTWTLANQGKPLRQLQVRICVSCYSNVTELPQCR